MNQQTLFFLRNMYHNSIQCSLLFILFSFFWLVFWIRKNKIVWCNTNDSRFFLQRWYFKSFLNWKT
jgi:hypothetical protein